MKLKFIICKSYALAGELVENSWFSYLGDCQILLKVNLARPKHLLSILNQISNNIQFTMGKNQTRLLFLDIMINNSGTKIWLDIYNKPADSKRYVSFTSNHPRHCLTNITFSIARKICTIAENQKVNEKHFKELKKNIARTKIPYVTNRS